LDLSQLIKEKPLNRDYGKRPEWSEKTNKPTKPVDEFPFEEEKVRQILLRSGSIIQIVPGTYKELRPHGKDEIYTAEDRNAAGLLVCGPTDEISAIWFEKSEVAEPPATT
jgi:hypothetical protein